MYGLIHAERGNIPVARACRALRVSRSGYYKWLNREPSPRGIDDAVLAAEVIEVFREHRGRYGAPRVRRVVGWAMSDRIDTELALSALRAAASTRALEPRWIHHTDRDCRYGSDDYLEALRQLGARPSMSRKGDCWDNAVAESFFATLEKELLALQPLQNCSTTVQQVADYIDNYYNLVRLHSHLDSCRRSNSRPTLRADSKQSNLSATAGQLHSAKARVTFLLERP